MKTPLQGEYELRTSSSPLEAMDKSLKVGEDEWREKEMNEGRGREEHEILCSK